MHYTEKHEPAFSKLTTSPDYILSAANARRYHEETIKEFPELFADKLPPRSQRPINPNAPVHRIELKDPKKTINGRLFALSEKFLNSMIDFLEEHLLAGRIRPSKSQFATGTWMISKKDPTAMPGVVHDYRALNENTVKDHIPFPCEDLIICQLAKAKYRGKLDCPNSYYQMAMHPDNIYKTLFKTPFRLFEWLVMPQGLCNAPAIWQRFINWILRKYVGKICHVYIDDITIFSDSLSEHHQNVQLVLQALQDAGIILSSSKSCLYTDEIEFLSHIISSRGIEVGPSKVQKILDWPVPQSPAKIRAFNGFVNYIAEFIPALADHSTMLSRLIWKGVEFEWTAAEQKAFDDIKRLAQNTPIYRPIDYNNPDPIYVVTDASNHAIGGYYGQGKDYRTMPPASFYSRALNPAERNYPTHDKELLAIIEGVKKWKPVLTSTRCEVLTDHASLAHLKSQWDLSPWQIRWNETLAQFDMDIHYISDVMNSAADALSRYLYIQ